MRFIQSVLVVPAVVSLAVASGAACRNTADGLQKDREQAESVTADARREARELASDVRRATANAGDVAAETAEEAAERLAAVVQGVDVKTALMADPSVDAARIDVDAEAPTHTIRLEGVVSTEAERDMAAIIAAGHAPGYRIDNQLTVAPTR